MLADEPVPVVVAFEYELPERLNPVLVVPSSVCVIVCEEVESVMPDAPAAILEEAVQYDVQPVSFVGCEAVELDVPPAQLVCVKVYDAAWTERGLLNINDWRINIAKSVKTAIALWIR